jgi:mannose-P-dolichol utilization defect protein 1
MEECVNKILNLNIEKSCITLLISKLLGYAIILVSFNFKVPQIRNMYKAKSAEGLNYLSVYMEIFLMLLSVLYSVHYNNPLSTYGENIIILAQNIIILLLTWEYSTTKVSPFSKLLVLSGLAGFSYVMLQPYIPEAFWGYLASITVVVLTISRASQIYTSWKTKSTGPLSKFTFIAVFLGNVARAFTSFTETNDKLLLFSYCYGALLGLIVLTQIYIYEPKTKKE